MGKTSIEWCDKTWNPVTGCTKVSQGCKNCYAEGVANRFFARQYPKIMEADGYRPREFTDVMTHADRLEQPLHWKKPTRIFVNSMSDLFHEDVPFDFIDRVFAVMALCPQHTFQILTKRPERMREYLSQEDVGHYVDVQAREMIEERVDPLDRRSDDIRATAQSLEDGPLPNVWLGVSCEDQKTADERIPLLLQTPAAARFVSYEPALGPVMFDTYPGPLRCDGCGYTAKDKAEQMDHSYCKNQTPAIDWLISGSESGPGHRPAALEWFLSARDQCVAAGVPYFHKQRFVDGKLISLPPLEGKQWAEFQK